MVTYTYEEGYGSGILSEHDVKYGIRDSIFRRMFSISEFRLDLYQDLFPDDEKTIEDDLEDVTIKNYLVNGQYNDIAFQNSNELLIMVEAQETWSPNLLPRMQLYHSEIIRREIERDNRMLFKSKKVKLPRPKYFVIYTGTNKSVKDVYYLSEEFGFGDDENIKVTVIKSGDRKSGIIYEYIDFSRRIHDIIEKKGQKNVTKEDLAKIIDDCIRDGILAKFLKDRRVEVNEMMESIFNADYYMRCKNEEAFEEGEARGIAIGEAKGIAIGKAKGIAIGKAEGIAVGKAEGIAVGKAEGIAVGEARGKRAGRIEERRNMAIEFLKAGTPIEVISKVTGFEPEYIRFLVKE